MKLTQPSTFGNTPVVGNVTYRDVGVYGLAIGVGALLFMSPVFKFNWFAIMGYIALVSILLGKTPTTRSMLRHLYGIVFKKPIRMVVSDQATTTTFGHGYRNAVKTDDMDTYGILDMNGNYAMVYSVTSDLNQWSGESDYQHQAVKMKRLFNILDGGEGLDVITKKDSDTGMRQLKESLDERENFEGEDFEALSRRRKNLLMAAATSNEGRSVQQYVILRVKPKNVRRSVKALRGTARLIRPAESPVDVLLAAMGFESGYDASREYMEGKHG